MTAICLDTETTGIKEPIPVEVAWAELRLGQGIATTEVMVRRFNPGRAIEWGAMATHHITNEDVAACEPWTAFPMPEGATYMVGHNVDFDWDAIGRPAIKRICTLALARHTWPTLDSHRLGALIYFIEGPAARERVKDAHSAAADIAMTATVLRHVLAIHPEVTTWEQPHALSEVARVPTIMAFGKHKGLPIRELPADYVGWLRRQADIDPYLIKALEAGRR